MTRLTKLICNRCRVYREYDNRISVSNFYEVDINRVDWQRKKGYELCDDCTKELYKFVEEYRKK